MKSFIAGEYTQNLKQRDREIKYYREALDDNQNNSLTGSDLGFVYMQYKKGHAKAVEIFQRTFGLDVPEAFIRNPIEG